MSNQIFECPDCSKIYKTYKRWYKHVQRCSVGMDRMTDVSSITSYGGNDRERHASYYKKRIKELETQNMELYAEKRDLENEIEAVSLKVKKHVYDIKAQVKDQLNGLQAQCTKAENLNKELVVEKRRLEKIVEEHEKTIADLTESVKVSKSADKNMYDSFYKQYQETIQQKDDEYKQKLEQVQSMHQKAFEKLQAEYHNRLLIRDETKQSENEAIVTYYTKEVDIQKRRYAELVETYKIQSEEREVEAVARESQWKTRFTRLSAERNTLSEQCKTLQGRIEEIEKQRVQSNMEHRSEIDCLTLGFQNENKRINGELRRTIEHKNRIETEKNALEEEKASLIDTLTETQQNYRNDFIRLRKESVDILETKRKEIVKAFENQIYTLKDTIANLETQLEGKVELQTTIEERDNEISRLISKQTVLLNQCKEHDARVKETSGVVEKLEHELQTAKHQLNVAKKLATNYAENLFEITKKSKLLESGIDSAEKHLEETKAQYIDQIDKLESSLSLKNQVLKREHVTLKDLRCKIKQLTEERDALAEKFSGQEQYNTSNKELSRQLAQVTKELEATKKSTDASRAERQEMQREIEMLSYASKVATDSLHNLKESFKYTKQCLENTTIERDGYLETIKKRERSLEHTERLLEETRAALKQSANKTKDMNGQVERLTIQLAKSKENTEILSQSYQTAQDELKRIANDYREMSSQHQKLEATLSKLQKDYKNTCDERNEFLLEMKELKISYQDRIHALNLELSKTVSRAPELETRINLLSRERDMLQSALQNTEHAKSAVEEDALRIRETLQNMNKDIESLRKRYDALKTDNDQKTAILEQLQESERYYRKMDADRSRAYDELTSKLLGELRTNLEKSAS